MNTNNDKPNSTEHEQVALQFERLVFFSDAVFAIAITLLVIEVKVPEVGHHNQGANFPSIDELQHEWPDELTKLIPKLAGYLFSFLVIGQYWLNHHRNFGIIRRFDRRLLWMNLLLLMSIAFIPFTTGFYSEYPYWSTTSVWYNANITIAGIIQWSLWRYASKGYRLIEDSMSPHLIDQISLAHLGVPIAFSLALIGGLLGFPFILSFTWVIIPLLGSYARRRYERRVTNRPVDEAEE